MPDLGDIWNRNVVSLLAFNALRGMVIAGFTTLFSMYMSYLGYPMSEIGSVITVSSIVLTIILPLLGYVTDVYGPRFMIAVTGAALTAAPFIAAHSTSLPLLGLAYSLQQFSFLAGQPARMSFLVASSGLANLGFIVGVTSSAFSASRIAGPALAGYLANTHGFQLAFQVLGIVSLAGLITFTVMSEHAEVKSKPRGPLEVYKSLIRPQRGFALLLGSVALDRFSWSLWYPMLSAFLYNAGFNEATVGYILSVSSTVETLLMLFAGKLADRVGAWATLAASEAFGLLAALLYSDPHPVARAALAASLVGASIATWIPSFNILVVKTSGGSGSAYASANTARGLAGAPAPYVGGYLYDALSPIAPFIVSAALLAANSVYAATLIRRFEEEHRQGEAESRAGAALHPQADVSRATGTAGSRGQGVT